MFEGVSCIINGDYKVGEFMIKDYCVFFILVIGSICMGKIVVVEVGSCLGKIILELGGNNVIIVMLSVDINVVFIGVFFGVVGIVG